MGKDKAKNSGKLKSNWDSSSNSTGFIGFSAFTSNLTNATDPDFQIDSEYQVQFKKLAKKDALSRLKALEELNLMFSKIDIESDDQRYSSTSIRALLSSWDIVFKRLVNDDDRKVREWSSICLGTLGSKVGKNLAPHLKSLFGPWLFSICDQKDQSYNTALQSFNTIFPEKKRKDVFKFAHDNALHYLKENLHETTQTLGDGKAVPPEVLQDRYERCISNSLLAIEFLIDNSTSDEQQDVSSTSQDIYQETFEEQFFSFLSSKSVNIRKTCYRLIATIVNRVPSYSDNNLKDLSTKILGLFSEKDPTTHLFMWDAIIAFLKKYGDKAWEGVDARKHVLPRFWAFLRSAAYGSHELSYPMILPFLSFIPESVVGDNVAFFQEFFGNFSKGLEIVENIKQLSSNERASSFYLSSYLECIVYCTKKWGVANQDIAAYLVNNLLGDTLLNFFGNMWNPFSDLPKLFAETVQRIAASKSESIDAKTNEIFDRLYVFTTRMLLEEIVVENAPVADPKKQAITLPIHLQRYDQFFKSASSIPQTPILSKRLFLFTCQHFNNPNAKLQDNMFEISATLLVFTNIQTLLQPEIKDTIEFINTYIIPNIKLSLQQSNSKSVYDLFNIYQIIANDKNESQDLGECWEKIISLLVDQDVQYFIHLLAPLRCSDRTKLASPIFDQIINKTLINSNNNTHPLTTTIAINDKQQSLLSVLLSNYNNEYSPLIKISTINSVIQWLVDEIKNIIVKIAIDIDGNMEFNGQYLIYATRIVFEMTKLSSDLNSKKTALLEETIKSILLIHHQSHSESSSNITDQFLQLFDTIVSLSNNTSSSTVLPILFNEIIKLKSPDFEFIRDVTADLILKDNSIDKFFELYLVSAKKYDAQMNVSWLQTDITPFKPSDAAPNAQDLENYFRVHLFVFDLLESVKSSGVDVVGAALSFAGDSNLLVSDLLTGLVAIDCSNQFSVTLLDLQSMVTFKVDFIDQLIKKLGDNLIDAQWLQDTLSSAVNSADNNSRIMVVRNITSSMNVSSSPELKQSFCSMIEKRYLESSLTGVIKSSRHLNLFQSILPMLVESKSEFVKQIRSTLFADLDAMTVSMPSSLDATCFKLTLLSSIVTQDDEHAISETEGHILLKILQIIQQWHLRARSPIMKDQPVDIDVIEVPLSQLFVIIAQYVVKKNLYLSANQSQLIQSLLNQWSSINASQDPTLLKRFNSLKIFNIILSDENNQKFILPNTSEEYLIELSSLLISQWITGTKHITNKSFVHLYDLYGITLTKITKSIQFKVVQANLKSIVKLLQSEHANIQLTSYNLLKSYFTNTNPSVELVKAYELSEDNTEFLMSSEEFSALLTQFELWKQLKNSKNDRTIIKKVVGHLLAWDLLLKNIAILDFSKKSPIIGYLNDKRKVSTLLSSMFAVTKKDIGSDYFFFEEFPRSDEYTYPYVQTICGYIIYMVIKNLPSAARSWWTDDCNSKTSQQVSNYITKYISPLIIKNEIQLVNSHREPAGSNFTLRGSQSIKEVLANYEKDEITISLSLQIPEAYPLQVLHAEFSKRVGVTEMQWRKWLLSMTSLLLTQDGTILDACLLWKSSLDKHFQGVELCPICYSLFFNGTIPKFQCKNCKNKFHAGCIYKWFQTSHKSTCPLCQVELQ